MEKILIRQHVVPAQSSRIIDALHTSASLEQLLTKEKLEIIISQVFQEKESFAFLQNEFRLFNYNQDSIYFALLYDLGNSLGLLIDSHITLFSLPDTKLMSEELKLFGWCYPLGQHYLGDTWWYSDQEILDDLFSLRIHEFIQKYRGINL